MERGGGPSLKAKKEVESMDTNKSTTNSKRSLRQIIITDVSRMLNDHVCVFGVDSQSNYIRPIIPIKGIHSKLLFDKKGNRIISPLSIVEFDFIRPYPEIPHTEDYIINPCHKPVLKRKLNEAEAQFFFENIVDPDVKSIFGTDIIENRFTLKNRGKRSIGTILIGEIHEIILSKTYSKNTFKVHFSDSSGEQYIRPITDCAFQKYYLNCLKRGINSRTLNEKLKLYFNKNTTYIRVGLGRLGSGKYINRGHWLIVTGIYSFPDYSTNLNL